MHFGLKLSEDGSMPIIYGLTKEYLCFERVLHVHYISIDDSVIIAPLKKKTIKPPLWSCSGRTGASRVRARCRFAAEPLHG